MKKPNVFQIILELIVILGFIVVGVTVLTFLIQHVAVDRICIGLIIIAVGIFGLAEYFTLKFAIRIRSIANIIASVAFIVVGIIFVIFKMEIKQLCLILGITCIGCSVARITTSVLNLLRQPLLNGIRIILNLILIVFSIFLIVKTVDFLNSYLMFLGIAFLIEAGTLFIEFLIHRYQN